MLKRNLLFFAVISFWITLIGVVLYSPSEKATFDTKSLNLFSWGDILEPSVIAEFEKKTGIKVNFSFYGSNEEMITKLKATQGVGYDLIVPSDYSVEILVKSGLLQPIDTSKLNFLHRLHPKFLNHFFDTNNHYSLPFSWELFILGIDSEFFQGRKINPSWKMVFDIPTVDYLITMPNDPFQTLALASFYLFGGIEQINDAQLNEITALLTAQKKHVNAYADSRADYFLATKNSAIAIASSSYIYRTMRRFPFVQFLIPQEGSCITIENLCIPRYSQKKDLSYQLINFLYTKEAMKTHFDTYATFPTVTDLLEEISNDPQMRPIIEFVLSSEKLHFTRVLTDPKKMLNAWVQIKTKYP